jgi:hypothetical protein
LLCRLELEGWGVESEENMLVSRVLRERQASSDNGLTIDEVLAGLLATARLAAG